MNKEQETLNNIEEKLTALLVLTFYANLPKESQVEKIEVLLDRSGISRNTIALITGRNRLTVDKIIQRANKK